VHTTIHRFLLTLLMLILPLQGFASASMLGCMLTPVPEQRNAEPMLMAGCHESGHSDDAPTSHSDTHCAICALATALPASFCPSPALAPTTLRFVTLPIAAFDGFIPDGPERPPRLPLA
jgi:hypothetical protein